MLELEEKSLKARMLILNSIFEAQSGHPGGSLSIIDFLVYLYYQVYRKGDKVVLSKGHAAPALYTVLAMKGFFDIKELKKLRNINSFLQGHPSIHVPGVDMCSGSLGQGLSVACGMALGFRYQGISNNVYAIIGDGECQEGQIWEALHFASQYHLSNLYVVVDWNNLQLSTEVNAILSKNQFLNSISALEFAYVEADGHDFLSIEKGLRILSNQKNLPKCLFLNTVKGKGVSIMENQISWHGKAPNKVDYENAMFELEQQLNNLKR